MSKIFSTPAVHNNTLSESEIQRRVEIFGKKRWELIKDEVRFEIDRIILPGFSLGLKYQDESGLYTRKQARERFGEQLIKGEQITELYNYIDHKNKEGRQNGIQIDDEDFFHRLLDMRGWMPGYFIEGGSTSWLNSILGKIPEGYTLSPSTAFGSMFIPNGTPTTVTSLFDGAINVYKIGRKVEPETQFKIRLQA